jgi:hypothetical protein
LIVFADILLDTPLTKRRVGMETEDLLRVINEFDFIRDDIDEIKCQLVLTKSEDTKISQAIANIEKAKRILVVLFPSIKSLSLDVREDLAATLMDAE